MTDQEKENRAGTENEEPKAAEAAANETAASEAVRDDEIKKLTADVEKQADEIKKLKEEVARARADYFNLRTRMERDRESNAKLAAEQAVKEMLPVFENLERAAGIREPRAHSGGDKRPRERDGEGHGDGHTPVLGRAMQARA